MYYRNIKTCMIIQKNSVVCHFYFFFQTLCLDHSRVKYNILVYITLYLKITIYD